MDREEQWHLQHVDLPTACASVYAALVGPAPDATEPAKMQLVLNDVARALAYVIRIYWSGAGMPQAIGGFDVMQGTFAEGARVFRAKSGEERCALTVQRRDMLRAIEVLRSAKVRFRDPLAA